jgi:NAD+ kinase
MIQRVGIVAKIRLRAAAGPLVEIAEWLDRRGVESVFEVETAALAGFGHERLRVSRDELVELVDLVLVLGGDGTLLSMADRIGQTGRDIPILGVNFGHLGFLTEISLPELFPALESALAGNSPIDERLMLHCRITRRGKVFAERILLNDVVIERGAMSRMLELSVSVGGQFVARFHADGLIIASPTGSTAYNLSAAGPIVHPEVDAVVLTPIAPHTLTNRPVVIPASAEVEVQPVTHEPDQQVYVMLDGQTGFQLQPGDQLTVTRAPHPLRLIRASQSYFEVLRQKLKWAER